MKEKIKILAIDDSPIFLSGLSALLKKINPQLSVKETETFKEAQQLLNCEKFDLACIDLDLRNSQFDGFHIARFIRNQYPDMKIIILTINIKLDYIDELFNSGLVDAYLDKKLNKQILKEALDNVLDGKKYIHPELSSVLEQGRWYQISNRERDVVSLLSKGMIKKEIADHLFISVNTVDSHVKNLFKKFTVNTVQGLVSKYVEYRSCNSDNPDEIPPFKN